MKCCQFKGCAGSYSALPGLDNRKATWIFTRLVSILSGCRGLNRMREKELTCMCFCESKIWRLRVTCSPMGPGRPGNPLGPSSPFWPNIPCCPLGPGSPSLPCGRSHNPNIFILNPISQSFSYLKSTNTCIYVFFLLRDFFALLILLKVMEYIQSHMEEHGSMPIFRHRLGWTVSLMPFLKVIWWHFHLLILYTHIVLPRVMGLEPFPPCTLDRSTVNVSINMKSTLDHFDFAAF